MVRYLKEDDVRQLLTMPIALEQVERAMKDRARGLAIDIPRERAQIPDGIQHMLQAAAPEIGYIGFKVYFVSPGGRSFFVHMTNTRTGKLDAIIEAVWMGMVRTGAASGVATKHLAVSDAKVVGQIGTGLQAEGQLEAVCGVRRIREARVYGRNRDKLEGFCSTMSARLGIFVSPMASAQDAVSGAHIINVITRAAEPVLKGEWLVPGQHINAAGSNALSRREIDEAVVKRCNVITVDARGTARKECGDLMPVVEAGRLNWDTLTEIGEVMVGRLPGRTSDEDVTLYESHGMGVQDLYVGAAVLALARERGVGVDLPIG
jgi:alanine dehydrogenase